uniref:Uncharacterized protein n=1 Tax=mine drainage metagenome TaxID=410659 RepID=E6QM61_9ZZZZ
MSLLDTNAQNDTGTDEAKSRMAQSALIALLTFLLGAGVVYFFAHTPPVLDGQVTHVWVHPLHTVFTPTDAAGVQLPPETFDQVLVLAQIHLHNQTDKPVILKNFLTNLELPDGLHSSYAATATDYDRVFLAYPELVGLRSTVLPADSVIPPAANLDGMIVSSFRITKADWENHKAMNFEIDLKLHPRLILVPKVPITEM